MRFKLWLLLTLITGFAIGQTENETVNEFIERYIENTSDELDIQQFASDLLFYIDNPIDLNKADAKELFAAVFLDGFQSLEIIEHRNKFGDFISVYELQVLPSFSVADIQEILPFVSLTTSAIHIADARKIWKTGRHQILSLAELNTPKAKGNLLADTLTDRSVSHYTGSALYNNLRYRFDYKRYISFGANMEKDAGEAFGGKQNPAGYDYYSFYFAARDIGKLKTLNLGDYQANFGQGLTLSTGLAFGKSSIITASKRNFNGFGAYRSLRENAYLRGGAVALELGNITSGVFASHKKVDGNTLGEEERDPEAPTITTSIQEDGGLHRTPSELADKDAITDTQIGFYLDYKLPFGRIGTVNYLRKLSARLEPNEQPYNQFNFRGNEYFKNGLYYDFVYRNVNIYGEVSHSSFENAIAQVHGALVSLHRAIDVSFVYRNYDKSFITLQSNGFGESSNASNENGFYSGFQAQLSNRFTLLGYYDLFTSPWLRFGADAPSNGNDLWTELRYKPSRKWQAYYRYRNETKQRNQSGENINRLIHITTQRHRLHLDYTVRKGIELRNRVEVSIVDQDNKTSFGSLVYQDIIYKPFGSRLQLKGRIAYSSIDQYENRIYSFEPVPLYDYPLFAHGFSGLRFAALLRYKVRTGLDIWFRYAHTQHDVPLNSLNSDYSIGSGMQETRGNIKQTYTLQVRYLIK